MNTIFISYRRLDVEARAMAGRVRDRLEDHFGKGEVFLDVESLHSGESFPDAIADTIRRSAVMLVMIGPLWANIRGDDGKPRLFNVDDWVRREITVALDYKIKIIPVPVHDTPPLDEKQAPDDIKKIASLHTQRVRGDPDFKHDIADLIDELERTPSLAKLHMNVAAAQRPPQAFTPQPAYTPPAMAPRPAYYPSPQATRGATRSLWIILAALSGSIALCAGLGYFASQFDSNGVYTGAFGQGSQRPAQVTNAKLFAAVDAAMRTCASAATATPANCPQSDASDSASGHVIWTLHGEPTSGSGATVRYAGSRSNGQFTVNGAYVFTVPHNDPIWGLLEVRVITGYYTATIHWNGSELSAASLAPTDTGPNVPRPEKATDSAVKAVARAYFADRTHCATYSACPLMPPYGQQKFYPTNTVYTFDGDQFATAHVTYQNTGVMLIDGIYSGRVTCQPASIDQCDNSIGGNFEFSLTMDSGVLQVIDVTYTDSTG